LIVLVSEFPDRELPIRLASLRHDLRQNVERKMCRYFIRLTAGFLWRLESSDRLVSFDDQLVVFLRPAAIHSEAIVAAISISTFSRRPWTLTKTWGALKFRLALFSNGARR